MKNFFLFATVLVFSACNKSDETAPLIQVNTPADNQSFNGGETVHIKATVTDETGIHMVHVMVFDNSNNGHVMHEEEHFDGKSYSVNKSFVTQAGRSYTIEVGAHDHANNSSKKVITVSAN